MRPDFDGHNILELLGCKIFRQRELTKKAHRSKALVPKKITNFEIQAWISSKLFNYKQDKLFILAHSPLSRGENKNKFNLHTKYLTLRLQSATACILNYYRLLITKANFLSKTVFKTTQSITDYTKSYDWHIL